MDILIIEDNKIQQKILTSVIERLALFRPRINIFIKNNGEEALDFIRKNNKKIDLIFTDFKMPIMNGLEFCDHFRRENKSTPIIMMTCNYEEAKNIIDNKLINYLIKKPINLNFLKKIIYNYYF